jgi:Major tropism determinant N-terminal domain
MATTPARMLQRRRTAAQWVSENPVLAEGEFGIVTGGDSPGLVIGDGTSAYNDLSGIEVPGWLLTNHDAQYKYPAEMQHNGTLISGSGADTGMPRITLADGATQRMKWMWEIPVGWEAIRVNMGVINENVATGNVRWQLTYKLIYLGEGNVDGAVTGTVLATLSSGGQFDWTYHQVAASIATPPGAFGDAPLMLCSLSRLGTDGADTLVGGISVGAVTCTRIVL